jgi:hypothetical protein
MPQAKQRARRPKQKVVVPEDFTRVSRVGHRLVVIEAIFDPRDRDVNENIDAAVESLQSSGMAAVTEDSLIEHSDDVANAILARRARRVD